MWWWLVFTWGCSEPVRSEAPAEAPERTIRPETRLGCAAGDAACQQADVRLGEIEAELGKLDCAAGGHDDPDRCMAERAHLEREKTAILARWSTTASDDAPSGGGAAPASEVAEPRSAPTASPRRRRPKPDGVEGMEIDVDDE